MTRSVFAIALLVCALVAASMAQDTITIPAGAGAYVFTGTAANWNAGTNTYSGAGPLTITFSPAGATSTNVNAITVSSSAAVTISNSGSVNAGLSIAAGGSLTVAAGAAPSFNAVNPGGSLNIPATASLTVTNTLNGNPSTLNVAGTLTATNGFTFNNIATPTFATTTVITATNNINLGFTSSVNFPAGGSISSSGGAVSVNTVGGTIAGSLTNSGGAVTVAGALTSALTVSGAVSASGAVSVTPTGAQNVAVSGAVNAGAGGVTVSNNNAPSVSVSGAVSTSGAATITGNAATATVTLSGATTASSLTISANGGTNGAVTLSGAATLTGALTLSATGNAASSIVASSAVAGATTVALNTPGSISVPSTGQIAFTGALTLGSSPSSINVAGKLLGTTTSATATVVLNPTGAATVSGTITSGTAANSLQLNAGAASTISGTLQSGSTIVFGSTAGAFGSTTYSINGGTLNFATSVNFNSPTTFNGVTFVAPQWTVQVSGGSSASGPTSQYTLTASGNTINSSLFPSGSNTNCVWVQSYSGSTVSSFLVSLPGNIQYRNYVSASPTALTVSSTNGGTVSFCTPNIQSTFDRRNDLNRNNLVYFGGNVVYYFTTSQALPFGAITPSDFTVTGGVISSISTIGGSSPAAYQIVVQITCDGVVNLAYNGSWTTASGTFLGEVSLGNVRVVSAKCISNIYAPCG